ncbi:unnamed protein product [Oikopleura dioica]|uniref:Mitochondrial inner membrane protein Mpv17 n=1 Tax=Oikopleura dioica TaxID=34765 RepID=E4XZ76_OIKDI|nr:unnamed protein product [Oikopleura dioica]
MRFLAARLVSRYDQMLQKRPLLTQCITAGTLCALGDVLAQQVFEKPEVHNYARTLKMGGFGFFYYAPLCSKWMVLAERLFPGTSPASMIKKVVVDQLIISSILMTCFLIINEVIDGRGVDSGLKKIEKDFTTMIVANWQVWVPTQFINFYFMPLHYRVIYINVVAFFWNIYVSWKAHSHLR